MAIGGHWHDCIRRGRFTTTIRDLEKRRIRDLPLSELRVWYSGHDKALRGAILPLIRFALPLRPYLSGIPAHCCWLLGTRLIESINSEIKVIKRLTYGCREGACYFLTIRVAIPGVGR